MADGLVEHGAPLVRLAVLDVLGVAALVENGVALPDVLGGRHGDEIAAATLALGLAFLARAENRDRVAVLEEQTNGMMKNCVNLVEIHELASLSCAACRVESAIPSRTSLLYPGWHCCT